MLEFYCIYFHIKLKFKFHFNWFVIILLLHVASLADLLIDLGEELPNGFHTGTPLLTKCFY